MPHQYTLEQFDQQQNAEFERIAQKYHEFLHTDSGAPEWLRTQFFEQSVSKAVRENDGVALQKHLVRVEHVKLQDFQQAVARAHFDVFCLLIQRAQYYGSDGVLEGLHAACVGGKQQFVNVALPIYLKNNSPHELMKCLMAAGKGHHFDIVNQLIPHAFVKNSSMYCLLGALVDENYELARLVYPHADVEETVCRLKKMGDQRTAHQGLQWIADQRVEQKLKYLVESQHHERTRKM